MSALFTGVIHRVLRIGEFGRSHVLHLRLISSLATSNLRTSYSHKTPISSSSTLAPLRLYYLLDPTDPNFSRSATASFPVALVITYPPKSFELMKKRYWRWKWTTITIFLQIAPQETMSLDMVLRRIGGVLVLCCMRWLMGSPHSLRTRSDTRTRKL